jgi:hypothetical protein
LWKIEGKKKADKCCVLGGEKKLEPLKNPKVIIIIIIKMSYERQKLINEKKK